MIRSLGVFPLLDIGNIGGNTPFSSINAKQSTAISNLGPVQTAVERAVSEGLHQMTEWVFLSKEGLAGYRQASRGESMMTSSGMPYMMQSAEMMPEQKPANFVYFDPKDIFIDVKLQPTMIQDKQAEAALAQLKQAVGFSKNSTLRELGAEDAETELRKAYEEVLDLATIQAQAEVEKAKSDAFKIVEQAKAAAQALMEKAQMTQQPQQPQQPQPQPQQPQGQFGPTEGMDGRFTGNSPAQVVPGRNRVQVNSRDDRGNPLT